MRIAPTNILTLALFAATVAGCIESDYDYADGSASAAAPAALGPGAVTVNWQAPSANEDGTPLVDLAGFRIRYGTKYGTYPNEITVNNPGATSQVVSGLAAGQHYFVVSAVNTRGQEGSRSVPQRIHVD